MKKLILTLAILISGTVTAQINAVDDFGSWTFNNTAGLEPYGAITTTLDYGNPYPNSDTTTMTSPIYYSSGNIDINFTLEGVIENGYDYMYFQYNIGGDWVTLESYTGTEQSIDYNYYLESVYGNVSFRFALVSDASVNTYSTWFYTSLYYFDVFDFTAIQDNSLPVEMDYFYADCEGIFWGTQSEFNSDYFMIAYSDDGTNFNVVREVGASGFSTTLIEYSIDNSYGEGYFIILRVDVDGFTEATEAIAVDCISSTDTSLNINNKEIQGYYNLMGQEVSPNATGVKIILYTDGTSKKVY
tara:strand:- start:635 stop:1534 length:900 start_codon:yes stop_codon:yes gene_type:complete